MNNYYLLIFIAFLVSGCSGQPNDGKVEIKGKVTWNGSALPEGKIILVAPSGHMDVATVKTGEFTIRTIPEEKTVAVTAEKVLGTPKPTERVANPSTVMYQYLPESVNDKTTLKKKVETGQELIIDLTGTEIPADPKKLDNTGN